MNSSKRYLSIDLLKGIGIIYLIFLHHIVWMFIKDDSGGLVFPEAYPFLFHFYHSILGFLGGQIPLLAGATFYISLQRKNSKFSEILGRALALVALGFLMNYLTWGWHKESYIDDVFDWDVLQFIALSMVVTYPFIKFLPDKIAVGALLGVGLFTLSLANKFPFIDLKDSYLYSAIIGDVYGENYWPFCPWFVFFAWGVLIGKVLCLESKGTLKKIMGIGFIFMILSILSGKFLPPTNLENIWGPSIFKPPPLFVLGIIGFSSVLISWLSIFLARYPEIQERLKESFIVRSGQAILWIYLISTIIGYNITYMVSIKYQLNFFRALLWLPFLIVANFSISSFIGRFLQRRKHVFYLNNKD